MKNRCEIEYKANGWTRSEAFNREGQSCHITDSAKRSEHQGIKKGNIEGDLEALEINFWWDRFVHIVEVSRVD